MTRINKFWTEISPNGIWRSPIIYQERKKHDYPVVLSCIEDDTGEVKKYAFTYKHIIEILQSHLRNEKKVDLDVFRKTDYNRKRKEIDLCLWKLDQENPEYIRGWHKMAVQEYEENGNKQDNSQEQGA